MGKLERSLSFPVILLITINSIMGTGIFFLPAVGAKVAGAASIISWIVLSLISIYIATCFGELSSMFPKAGGIYEFCKQAYGSFTSFVIGWMTLIAGNVTIAMLVVGAVRYLNPSLPYFAKIGISLGFILAFNLMAYEGMKTSAVMLVAFSIITLTSIFGLIIPGIFHFQLSNILPLVKDNFFATTSLVFIGIFFIAETFFGWETATFLAEETKNPRKVLPKALVYGTVLIALICISFVLVSLGSIKPEVFGSSLTPLTDLSKLFYGSVGGTVFTLLVYLSIIGSVAGWVVAGPRLILALAEDKLFLSQCARIHPEKKTPYIAILFQTVLTSILVVVGSGSYETLLEILLPLVLVIYSFTILSVTVLRYKKPDLERFYTAPFGKVGPIATVIILFSLIGYWLFNIHGAFTIARLGVSFVIVGIPIYFLLSFYYNPEAIMKFNALFSRLSIWMEDFLLPVSLREELVLALDDLEGKTVLEFGSGVGTFTMHLAEEVGAEGEIIATDLSEKSLSLLEDRLKEEGHEHVSLLHDPHQVNRIHPRLKNMEIDAVFSVGNISYIQEFEKIVSDLNEILPPEGEICFLEYTDYFKFLPNAGWLSKPEKIEEIFRENGFSVEVSKINGWFWNYLFIYGRKKSEDVPYI